jgi:imidazolonepropionase-like amidohydrolase
MKRSERRRDAIQFLLAALLCIVCSGSQSFVDPPEISATVPIAFTNVRVLSMTGPTADTPIRTVIVQDGRIVTIGAPDAVTLPQGTVVIDGAGRYLMPALSDMHVHLARADLPAYLKSGIARVRNMWGHPTIATLMRETSDGTTLGPTIHSVSSGLDGSPAQWPFTQIVDDPKVADSTVAAAVNAGWSTIKVYQRLSLASYDSIVASAKRRGLTFAGHVPTAVSIAHALASGQRSIEHLTGYDMFVSQAHRLGTWAWADADASKFASLAAQTATAGTWNCPTLAIYVELSKQHSSLERQRIIASRREFIAHLHQAGAPLLVGTDAGIDVVAPGTSIHDELAEFVAAGLTPYESLRIATAEAARYLGIDKGGTIVVGAPADLLLLPANPLADISQVKRFNGMMLRGAWYTSATLNALR